MFNEGKSTEIKTIVSLFAILKVQFNLSIKNKHVLV